MTFSARQGFFSDTGAVVSNGRRTGAAATIGAQTWTQNDPVSLDTTTKKFGAGSLDLESSAASIEGMNVTILDYGTGDFTLEWWQYIPSLSGHSSECQLMKPTWFDGFGMSLNESGSASGSGIGGLSSGSPKWFSIFINGGATLDRWDITTRQGGGAWTAGQWYFCALQRQSSVLSFWVDGRLCERSGSGGGTYDFPAGAPAQPGGNWAVYIGGEGPGPTPGAGPILLDEMCFSNTWRYPYPGLNIPVPSAPFTVDEFTTQLLHLDAEPFVNDTGS